ncbi:MAG: hypothetical protein H7Z76_03840 [Methylotenera sp.]|nr:hypothetical protein [Flavobacterium sp.]
MQNKINLEHLDDEQLTLIKSFMQDKDEKIHTAFFNNFAINSISQDYEIAVQITEAMQELEISIIFYEVLLKNKEFTKTWIDSMNIKPNYRFFIGQSIKEETTKRIHDVLDKRLIKDTYKVDKILKI